MKLAIYIGASYSNFDKKYNFSAFSFDPTGGGYVLTEKQEMEFTPPPDEVLAAGTIAAYRTEQQRIRAEAQAKVTSLQQQIDEMLCLEHKTDLKVAE